MKLEQSLYQVKPFEVERGGVYQVEDLEYLSASVLYTGDLPPMGPGGFGALPFGKKKDGFSDLLSCKSLGPIKTFEMPKINLSKNTAYFPLLKDANQTIGVTHHSNGLGKLKILDGGIEYGTPLIDILNKSLKDWRIDKK